MKTKNISHLAALLIMPATLSSSVLAGPGPQTPPSFSKRSDGKTVMALQRPKVITPTTGPKGPVISYVRPTLLTAGQGAITVWH